jgi:hypothetical protein
MGKWVHRLTNINVELGIAECAVDGVVKVVQRRNGVWQCDTGKKQQRNRDRHKRKIGWKRVTNEICPICGRLSTQLVYDHNHLTDEFRGYICGQCNMGLGMFKDNIESLQRAILYLNEN